MIGHIGSCSAGYIQLALLYYGGYWGMMGDTALRHSALRELGRLRMIRYDKGFFACGILQPW
jgi:hypothetical protein